MVMESLRGPCMVDLAMTLDFTLLIFIATGAFITTMHTFDVIYYLLKFSMTV